MPPPLRILKKRARHTLLPRAASPARPPLRERLPLLLRRTENLRVLRLQRRRPRPRRRVPPLPPSAQKRRPSMTRLPPRIATEKNAEPLPQRPRNRKAERNRSVSVISFRSKLNLGSCHVEVSVVVRSSVSVLAVGARRAHSLSHRLAAFASVAFGGHRGGRRAR